MTRLATLGALALAAALAGCGAEDAPAPAPRPVLSVLIEPAKPADIRFAGTVEPRFSTDRGFQVLGRILSYGVDVGDLVGKGQPLAALDPTTFALEVRSKEGDLERAKSQAANAAAEAERARELVARNVSTQAELDADIEARDGALAAVRQAEAELAKAREELGYATLVSDADGVVTRKNADVGQTVTAGQTVMTIARTDMREAVVDLPEGFVAAMAPGAPFRITLQADPSVAAHGRVREIAPEADAATRTRRTRIALDRPPEAFRLGTTIAAAPEAPETGDAAAIELPRAAILEKDGASRVWLVDPQAKTVRSVPVELRPDSDAGVARIAAGLAVGQRVVVAGVRSLGEGQQIRFDEKDAQ